jgi:hypothetical protein
MGNASGELDDPLLSCATSVGFACQAWNTRFSIWSEKRLSGVKSVKRVARRKA